MKQERIIWLLLLSGALAFAVGKNLNRGDGIDFKLKTFWINKTFASSIYDFVLLGDSRTYRGIDPQSISKLNNNVKVLNFGYSSAGFSNEYIDAGVNKLSAQGKKVVVFCFTPFSLTSVASKNEHFLMESARKKEEVIEAKYFSDLMYFFRPVNPQFYFQARYLEDGNTKTDSLYYHQEPNENGWVASWKLKRVFAQTVESYKKEFENNLPQQKAAILIIEKVKSLKAKGFTVIGLRLPVQNDLFLLEESIAGSLFKSLESQFVSYGGVWLDLPLVSDATYDASHLDKNGAIAFSTSIGMKINTFVK
jgi:hypothetical protein